MKRMSAMLLVMLFLLLVGCLAVGTETDYPAAIMAEGTVYLKSVSAMPAEIDESAIIGYTTSYTDTYPEKDGETNFNRELNMPYARVEGGIKEGDWVLICTGMNQRWGENDDYFAYSPGLSIEGAHWFVDHKVKGVGFDLQALDHILYTYAAEHGPGPYVPRIVEQYIKEFGHSPLEDFPEWEPVHEILLGNNVMGIENLGGDIEKVKGQRFMFCAFPLRWYMGDGTIVRAVAFIDEDKLNKDVPDRVYKYGVY